MIANVSDLNVQTYLMSDFDASAYAYDSSRKGDNETSQVSTLQ